MKNRISRVLVTLTLLALPLVVRADSVSVTLTDDKGAQAIFQFIDGCITTEVIAGLNLQKIRHPPGNETESFKFLVTNIRQVSDPANGPECEDAIIQDSFFSSDDVVGNFHPTVMEVSPNLDYARFSGTGSAFDSFHGIQRDMAFDFTWDATGALEEMQDHQQYEDGDSMVDLTSLFLERDGVASGSLKECDNEFDGPVDGLCTAADLATAPNLVPVPSDPMQTVIFRNTFIEARRTK